MRVDRLDSMFSGNRSSRGEGGGRHRSNALLAETGDTTEAKRQSRHFRMINPQSVRKIGLRKEIKGMD